MLYHYASYVLLVLSKTLVQCQISVYIKFSLTVTLINKISIRFYLKEQDLPYKVYSLLNITTGPDKCIAQLPGTSVSIFTCPEIY